MTDPHPARRALAACLAGQLGDARQKEAVRRLLKDKAAHVRLRAAQGLLAGMDATGVPALIALLDHEDTALAWQAEELLHFLAGETAPDCTVGAGSAAERKRCRKAWEEWRRKHGDKADPAKAFQEPGRPGLLLVVCAKDGLTWSASLFGCRGLPRWNVEKRDPIVDVHLLPNNHLLLAQDDQSNRGVLTQMSLPGQTIHKQPVAEIRRIRDCKRLANGSTWVAARDEVRLLSPQGRLIDRRELAFIALDWDPSGRLLALEHSEQQAALAELEPFARQLERARVAVPLRTMGQEGFLQSLPDGGALVSGLQVGLVAEFDRGGKRIWESWFEPRCRAIRLPNGRTLVARGDRITEIDRQGRVTWEAMAPFKVEDSLRNAEDPHGQGIRRVRPCLNLVRVGFPASEIDIDGSIAYRGRMLSSKEERRRFQSARVLARSGPAAQAVLPALTKAMVDPSPAVRDWAGTSLAALGPRAKASIPALIEAMGADESFEYGVLWVFSGIGPAAQPALLKALRDDPRPRVRSRAALAAAKIIDLPLPVAELQAALKDRDVSVRRAVISVLANAATSQYVAIPDPIMPEQARTDVKLGPTLIQALADKDELIRSDVLSALAEMGAEADPALPVLRKLLPRDGSGQVLMALANIGQRDPSVLPMVLPMLDDNAPAESKNAAIRALGKMGVNGKAAVPRLLAMLCARQRPRRCVMALGGQHHPGPRPPCCF